ncbi:MAG: hypothetical protein AAF958_15930 [Planctomycetota bacterium]
MTLKSLRIFSRSASQEQIKTLADELAVALLGSHEDTMASHPGPLTYPRSLIFDASPFTSGFTPLRYSYSFVGQRLSIADTVALPAKLGLPEALGVTIWTHGPYLIEFSKSSDASSRLGILRGPPPHDDAPAWEPLLQDLLSQDDLGHVKIRKGLGKPIVLEQASGVGLREKLNALNWRQVTFVRNAEELDSLENLMQRLPDEYRDAGKTENRYWFGDLLSRENVDLLAETLGGFTELIVSGKYADDFHPLGDPDPALFDTSGQARFPLFHQSGDRDAFDVEASVIHRRDNDPVLEVAMTYPLGSPTADKDVKNVLKKIGDEFKEQSSAALDRYADGE